MTPIQMHDHLPPGILLISADDFETWFMDIKVLDDNPLYRGQTYRLKFAFSNAYVSLNLSAVLSFARSPTPPLPSPPSC